MLIVQVCDFGNDGDAQYRLHDPSRFLGQLPGVTAIDCHFYHRALPDLAKLADVLIVQFVNDWELLSLCERRRAAGQITVFEANDYFFDLQSWNPIAVRWRDRTIQELYLQLLVMADGVQTSTPELAKRWQQRGARQVGVFHNQLVEVPPLPPIPQRPLTVGWAGSPGHFADWYHFAPHLERWLIAHPDVHLAVMNNEMAKPFIQLPPERYSFTPFGSLADYLRFLRSLDIGLAPLLPTDYNRCRSDVKFLEYAAQGVAGIYADLEPYRASVQSGKTGLLCRGPNEMIDGLEFLSKDEPLRQKIRTQAYDYVRRDRVLRNHIAERLAWYKGLLKNAQPSQSPLPDDIVRAAQRDGNYLRLHIQQPEQTLLDALNKPNAAEATPRLAQLVEQHPRYLAALQSLGQLLNDRRDHRAALTYLKRARELAPNSARIWSEIGRALYRLNEDARARAALEEAIRVNPRYLPGWQYLLRMLSLSNAADGPDWARRAEEMFPTCYPLALLAVENYPPGQAVDILLHLLKRHAPTIAAAEKQLATAAFRQAIMKAVKLSPTNPETLTLLRRACEVFPESVRLADELAAHLFRAGEVDEACRHQARALDRWRSAAIYKEEFGIDETPPWMWQVGEHIRDVTGEES